MSNKIRTFSLELLSNIEMLEEQLQLAKARQSMSWQHFSWRKLLSFLKDVPSLLRQKLNGLWSKRVAPSDLFFKGIKRDILIFFREKACKQATLRDYAIFLTELLQTIKQANLTPDIFKRFTLIIQRHQELIALQDKIKPPALTEKQKRIQRNWNRVRNFVRSGLLVKDIEETALQAKGKELPFDVLLPVPDETKLVNLYPLIDAANRLNPEYRSGGQWLFSHLKIFTFRELCHSIKEACFSLHQNIHAHKGYHILTVKNKSQEWVMNIAWRYLPQDKLPQSVYRLFDWTGEELLTIFEQAQYKHFIMFDDAMYSGAQLEGLFQTLRMKFYMPNQSQIFADPIHFTIVIGFMSLAGEKRVAEQIVELKKHNIHINLISNRRFNDIKSDWIEEKVEEELKNKILDVIESGEDTIYKTTAITEWKKPDCWSTPKIVSEGHTRWPRCYTTERLGTTDEYLKACVPFDEEEKPIINIKTPYRKGP